jgi:hypothetical protein
MLVAALLLLWHAAVVGGWGLPAAAWCFCGSLCCLACALTSLWILAHALQWTDNQRLCEEQTGGGANVPDFPVSSDGSRPRLNVLYSHCRDLARLTGRYSGLDTTGTANLVVATDAVYNHGAVKETDDAYVKMRAAAVAVCRRQTKLTNFFGPRASAPPQQAPVPPPSEPPSCTPPRGTAPTPQSPASPDANRPVLPSHVYEGKTPNFARPLSEILRFEKDHWPHAVGVRALNSDEVKFVTALKKCDTAVGDLHCAFRNYSRLVDSEHGRAVHPTKYENVLDAVRGLAADSPQPQEGNDEFAYHARAFTWMSAQATEKLAALEVDARDVISGIISGFLSGLP